MSITVCFHYKQIPIVTSLRKDNIFGRQDILQFFSGVSKDYKYVKFPNTRHYIETFHEPKPNILDLAH